MLCCAVLPHSVLSDSLQSHGQKVKVVQSFPTLCDNMYCIVYRILQARILEWITIPFSRESSDPRN